MTRAVLPAAVALTVLALSPTAALADPCACYPPGCPCACECSYSGMIQCSASITCQSNQSASCSCDSTGCSSSCSTNTNQGISHLSLLQRYESVGANLHALAVHVAKLDPEWTVALESGLSAGAPVTRDYEWESGLEFETALDTVAGDFSACADVDWANRTVTFRAAGNCS